jgi:hypothetical protein
MTFRNSRFVFAPMALFVLLGGCVAAPGPGPEKVEDTRLDQLVSNMNKSLANQATVNTELQEQRRQLEIQQQHLELMSQDLGKALTAPVEANCPKVEACPAAPKMSGKMVVGAREEIWLSNFDFAVTARVDTGVETSSLDASAIELFERDGKRWVRFEIVNPETGKPVALERRLERTLGIVKSGVSKVKRRPVVEMGIVIGNIEQTAEFSLRKRSHKGYQALIGRSILQDVMVVDVSQKNLAPYVLPEKSSNDKGSAK